MVGQGSPALFLYCSSTVAISAALFFPYPSGFSVMPMGTRGCVEQFSFFRRGSLKMRRRNDETRTV